MQLNIAANFGGRWDITAAAKALARDVRDGNVDPDTAIWPSLKPGDAMLFENRTWHAAGGNFCDYTRKCVMFGYGYHWIRPDHVGHPSSDMCDRLDDIGRQLVSAPNPSGHFQYRNDDPLRAWCKQHNVPMNAQQRKTLAVS